jgi:capsid protein
MRLMALFTQIVAGCFEAASSIPRSLAVPSDRPIRARYDAAADDSNETKNIWSAADALDADAANSLAVRIKLRKRSRYERMNNGHASGIIRTQGNYIVGTGPKLRMLTGSPGFNSMVEAAWKRWAKAVGFAKKIRTMCRAKVGDGEAFCLIIANPNCPDPVKLEIRLIECDQVSAPSMKSDDENYVDGIRFDEFNNPISYDILRRHPGASWWGGFFGKSEYDTFPAKFVCHWFGGDERPGQHRGVPELTPTLNLFATGRRYREAVVAAAETAADIAAMVEMGVPMDGADTADPFVSLPIRKRTMTILPGGAKASQMKAEQPSTTYDGFTRTTVCEEARPLNMPYNIAACDSSDYSYSGGQLDHQTYFVSIDVERQDCEQAVLDKVFALWFEEAVRVYGWVDTGSIPDHSWGWMGKLHSDPTKIADARRTRLSCGDAAPSEFADEDGVDYEDRLAALARDYGVTVEQIKAKLFEANFQKSGGGPSPGEKPDEPPTTPANARANGKGHNRILGVLA